VCRIVSFRPWDSCGGSRRDPYLWGFCGPPGARSGPRAARWSGPSHPVSGLGPSATERSITLPDIRAMSARSLSA
jgi:hypothetical protein